MRNAAQIVLLLVVLSDLAILGTSRLSITAPKSTLQNRAIFRLTSSVSGRSVRQIRMSGWIPISISSRTECCVGLVLSSPAAAM